MAEMITLRLLSRAIAIALVAIALVIGVRVLLVLSADPAKHAETEANPPDTINNEEAIISTDEWMVFGRSPDKAAVPGADAAQVVRYVGPFISRTEEGTNIVETRSAIIELIEGGEQDFVKVGDFFASYEIRRIEPASLFVRRDGVDYELHLSFTNLIESTVAAGSADRGYEEEQALEVNRFGKRIGEHRWVVQRQAILDYYKELSDDPERLVAVFDSLEPDYDEERKIKGYKLVTKGEADFFKAIGLTENDYVRKVNSMNMISRQRAEYFIGEFMKERLGGVVLDIERNGKPEKLIYFVR